MRLEPSAYVDRRTGEPTPEGLQLARRLIAEAGPPVEAILALAAEHGRRLGFAQARGERACRICGCTEPDACPDPTHGGCAWAGQDLCTACAPYQEKPVKRPSAAELQSACDAFNREHPIGSRIRVCAGPIGTDVKDVEVRDPGAIVLGGHTPVVYVTGGAGCIALSHVLEQA
jgi:hypothetical protein